MKTRRLISRFFAAAFVMVVLQQFGAAPAFRVPARIEQAAASHAASKKWREALPAATISRAWSLTAISITLSGEDPRLRSSATVSPSLFQRPPPAA